MENNECSQAKQIVGKGLPQAELDYFQNDKIGTLSLADLKGKWLILFFYPADFTFICPTELQEMATMYLEFKNLNTEVVSVSTDTAFTHKAWHDSSPAIKTVEFPMAADHNGSLSRELGVYIQKEGVSLRATLIVDPEGIVKSMEVNDNSIGRSAKELLRKLQAAQYVAAHNGEVCPASWTPGAQTLKPGVDLVGKI